MVKIDKNNGMQGQAKQYDNHTDDHADFGLPEVNYSPVEREDDTPPAFVPPIYYFDQKEEEAIKGWLVAAATGFFVVIGLFIYFV